MWASINCVSFFPCGPDKMPLRAACGPRAAGCAGLDYSIELLERDASHEPRYGARHLACNYVKLIMG